MPTKPSMSNLEVRVGALEILVYRMVETIATAKIAEKTADKALAMAQEALVIVTSAKSQEVEDTEDPFLEASIPPEEATPDVSVRALRGLASKRAAEAKRDDEIVDDEKLNKLIEAEDAAAESDALRITTE